jgi:hypothetical protein
VDEEKSLWPARLGFVLAVVAATACSLWLLPDAIRQHASELHAGEYTGTAVTVAEHLAVIIAIAFALLYVLFLRTSSAGRSLTYLAAIVFVVADVDAAIVYATKSAGHERSFQYAQVPADIRKVVDDRLNNSSPDETQDTLRVRAANVSRTVATISRDEAARINNLRASYQSQALALVLNGTLKPKSLAADGGIKTARAHIAEVRELIKKYRSEEQKIFAETRSTVRHTPIDDSVRQQMLAAFERSLRQRETASAKMWDCEDALLVESDHLVHDLANSQSAWHAQGNEFLFTSHRDLNAFRSHVQKIQEIQQNERMLTAESGDTVVTTVQY